MVYNVLHDQLVLTDIQQVKIFLLTDDFPFWIIVETPVEQCKLLFVFFFVRRLLRIVVPDDDSVDILNVRMRKNIVIYHRLSGL
jgi:hypothetical protein